MTFAASTTTVSGAIASCSERPAGREPGVQGELRDVRGVVPHDVDALAARWPGQQSVGRGRDDRDVGPAAVVVVIATVDAHLVAVDRALLGGFAQGPLDRRLVARPRPTEQSPGVAEMTPLRPVLQQHLARTRGGSPVGEQPGGAVPTPVPVTRRAHHPAVAVAVMIRACHGVVIPASRRSVIQSSIFCHQSNSQAMRASRPAARRRPARSTSASRWPCPSAAPATRRATVTMCWCRCARRRRRRHRWRGQRGQHAAGLGRHHVPQLLGALCVVDETLAPQPFDGPLAPVLGEVAALGEDDEGVVLVEVAREVADLRSTSVAVAAAAPVG